MLQWWCSAAWCRWWWDHSSSWSISWKRKTKGEKADRAISGGGRIVRWH